MPPVTLAQLDFLPLRMASIQRHSQKQSHVLPPVADRVLIQRDISGYASNSEAEFAACMSLVAADYSDPDILRVFEAFSPPHYEKVGDRHFGQYVLNSARAYVERADQVTARSGIAHSSSYVQWAQSQPWPGRTGATDRAVFLALCEREAEIAKAPIVVCAFWLFRSRPECRHGAPVTSHVRGDTPKPAKGSSNYKTGYPPLITTPRHHG